MEHRGQHTALLVGAGRRHLNAADGAALSAAVGQGATITEWLREDLLGKAGLSRETEHTPILTTPQPSTTTDG